MNWLSFLVAVLSIVNLCYPAVAWSESGNEVVIQSISHVKDSEVQETIRFKLAAPVVPKIFVLGGEKPRLVIDFPEAVYLGKNVMPLTDGVLASAIRTGLHQTPVTRTRAVVDLSKQLKVKYSSQYQTEDNTLVVTLTADEQQPQLPDEVAVQKSVESSPAAKPEPALKSSEENVVPAVVTQEATTEEKPAVKPLLERIQKPTVPTILEISFDDSSSKGEMALFRLNDFYPPTVSAIEKGSPRVLCDFMSMDLGPNVQQTILAQGKYIERIRTARHQDPDKVRVVLDLAPDRDYDLQQVYFRNDNLFVLIVNELSPKQDK